VKEIARSSAAAAAGRPISAEAGGKLPEKIGRDVEAAEDVVKDSSG